MNRPSWLIGMSDRTHLPANMSSGEKLVVVLRSSRTSPELNTCRMFITWASTLDRVLSAITGRSLNQ